MRRLLTFLFVAVATAFGALHWVQDGDVASAVEPVVAEWDAELLARDAGLTARDPGQQAPDTLEDAAEPAP